MDKQRPQAKRTPEQEIFVRLRDLSEDKSLTQKQQDAIEWLGDVAREEMVEIGARLSWAQAALQRQHLSEMKDLQKRFNKEVDKVLKKKA